MNFSEAQYICNQIYSGSYLVSINSLTEQKALPQYLYNEIGFKRSPVCWLDGRMLSVQYVVRLEDFFTMLVNRLKIAIPLKVRLTLTIIIYK